MTERTKEEEVPFSPKADSPIPEIFSTKKIFFLNSCSGNRRSEIPHIESDYCPRDEVSRRLFYQNTNSCDCDCSSDGCWGCLKRNRQCFFKVFVLTISVALILLLFGSISYNLTRTKVEEEFEFEKTKWVSHYHKYPEKEERESPKSNSSLPREAEPELKLPVPVYEPPSDYDLLELQYHLDDNREQERIEPISFNPLNSKNPEPILIIEDGRKPLRMKRSIQGRRHAQTDESLFEGLNSVEEGMENFWETVFKRRRTVFEPFSLTTPLDFVSDQSDEYSMEDEIEDELKSRFLVETTPETSVAETSTETTLLDNFTSEQTEPETETESPPATDGSTPGDDTTEGYDETDDGARKKESRSWPVFHYFPGLFGASQQDEVSAEPSPKDTVKGISLADAKKIKKERRKQMLLNSRVVGGSSDVRLPTGPDISKPVVNAFESLKTNQQLSFTPSAASQFILPYQMCLFGGPFPGFKSPVMQPRTFSLAAPTLFPSVFDKNQLQKPSFEAPTQQNFLSFSINNYPNAPPPRQPPSGGSYFSFPGQQPPAQYPGLNKQPIFCTYLQPPLFQFPTVPGTADFSHAKCVDCEEDSRRDAHLARGFVFPSGRETLCMDDKVSCVDGSNCIPLGSWCDNRVHCKDASDEMFCSCRERVGRERICDGYVDCPHGEDEMGCYDCPKSAFSCDSVISPDSCIPLSKRCDGVRDCATGADEADCSALLFHVHHNSSYQVSQVSGYLHRNWKGDWFPVCVELGEAVWATEACLGELGVLTSGVDVRFATVPPSYKGPFLVRKEDGTAVLQDHCKGHVSTFVKCPPVKCGTRVEPYGYRGFFQSIARSSAADSTNQDERRKREETGRVVGGRESEPRAWPWAIAVYKNGAFHCGGVILDENWVLTAAHCMEQYWKHYYEVRGGMLRRFSFSAMEQSRTVSHVIIHENYDPSIMSNDLALLRLEESFLFNRWVRPACLPVLQEGISKFVSGPAPGTRCTAVGWGALRERGIDPDQLREVEIPIMTRCKHKEDLVGAEICAGKAEGGKDTCQGDSGGPLLCRDSDESWYVAGIVSHGEGCARPGEPGAYTRISLYIDWITANTNDFQLPTVKPLKTCPGFRCRSASKLCIPRSWICNGYSDCLEAEDEKNCTSVVQPNIFGHRYSNDYFVSGERTMEKPSTGSFVTESHTTEEREEEITAESTTRERITDAPATDGGESSRTENTVGGTERTQGFAKFATVHEEVLTTSMPMELLSTGAGYETPWSEEPLTVVTEAGLRDYEKPPTTENYFSDSGEDETTQKETGEAMQKETGEAIQKENEEMAQNEIEETTQKKIEETTPKENEEMTQNESEETTQKKIEETTQTENEETTQNEMEETTQNEIEETTQKKNEETTQKENEEMTQNESDETTQNEIEETTQKENEETTQKEIEEMTQKKIEETAQKENEEMTQNESEEAENEEKEENKEEKEEKKKFEEHASHVEIIKDKQDEVKTEEYDSPEDTETENASNSSEETTAEGATGRESEVTEALMTENRLLVEEMPTTKLYEHPIESSTVETQIEPESNDQSTDGLWIESTSEMTPPQHSIHTRGTETVPEEFSTSGLEETSPDVTQPPGERGDYFQCRLIVQSILASYRCDGFVDCEDGTDEENCSCGQAVDPKRICDGRMDCPDGSDEKNCPKCPEGEFLCKKSDECIPLQKRCDGNFNCKFGEDEAECLALTKTGTRLRRGWKPPLETEGVLVANRNGMWQVKCQEETSPLAAGDAVQVCSSLGTIGYEKYENRSLGPNCMGFHVTCAKILTNSISRYQRQNGSYLWPWNAFVYSDGRAICSAVLLRPRWMVTSSSCLKSVSLKQNYLNAKLGSNSLTWKKKADERTIRIDGAHVMSNVALLHLSEDVLESESVRFLGLPYILESDPSTDLCVATGARTVFLKHSEPCSEGFKCFEKSGPTTPRKVSPLPGIVVCQSRFGWYPSAVISDTFDFCDDESVRLTSLQDNLTAIFNAMDAEVEVFPEPLCSGIRCSEGRCLHPNQTCNGWPDCFSGEDETLELCKKKECQFTELKCLNGRCVPKVSFGDGKNDCGDNSDEPRDPTCVEYLRVTAPERICDGRRNCFDKTDEDYRMCSCDSHKFQCKLSGFCIPNDYVCDGDRDCPGGEDEDECMGRKLVRNHTKSRLEVMQKSFGVWHTVCPNQMSKEYADALCRDLGFKESLFVYERNQTVSVPELDPFTWVKLNQKTSVALRGNKPIVRLLRLRKTCQSVKCA